MCADAQGNRRRAPNVPSTTVIGGKSRGRTSLECETAPDRISAGQGPFPLVWRVQDSNLGRLSRRIYSPTAQLV
jgi:hypothetical protein